MVSPSISKPEQPSEKMIQTQIMTGLSYKKNVFVWRANTGGFLREYTNKDGRSHRAFIHAGIKGSSDIQGVCQLKNGQGCGLYIEVKRPGGKVSEDQKSFIDRINRLGSIAIVATSFDEVKKQLNERGCMI